MKWIGTVVLGAALLLPSSTAVGQVGHDRDGVVDPNLAGRDELLAVPGMNAAAVDAVMAGRPFLTMLALDSALRGHVEADALPELYRRVFIPVNLNTASRAEILLVPGVGARMAREFEEYRPYVAMPEFRREIGKYVDADEVARLEQYVFVPIDLNTASEEDILSIPGVGRRMLREFLEYRPYSNLAQFRREIGKYVDAKEVARLERYVTIRQ